MGKSNLKSFLLALLFNPLSYSNLPKIFEEILKLASLRREDLILKADLTDFQKISQQETKDKFCKHYLKNVFDLYITLFLALLCKREEPKDFKDSRLCCFKKVVVIKSFNLIHIYECCLH